MTAKSVLAAPVPKWLVSLLALAAAGGVAWGAASTKTASIDGRVSRLETVSSADHDLLQRLEQKADDTDRRLDDLDSDVRRALSLPPRR